MKKLSYALFGLAVLLSDVMCWMVGYRYSDMLWGIRYACYSAPAWTAWLTALPFLGLTTFPPRATMLATKALTGKSKAQAPPCQRVRAGGSRTGGRA